MKRLFKLILEALEVVGNMFGSFSVSGINFDEKD